MITRLMFSLRKAYTRQANGWSFEGPTTGVGYGSSRSRGVLRDEISMDTFRGRQEGSRGEGGTLIPGN